MKTTFKKQPFFLCVLSCIILLTACQNEDETATSETSSDVFSSVIIQRNAEIDLISDDIGMITEEAMEESEAVLPFLPNCVTITTKISAGFRERTLDFGEGCELPNGSVVSGAIIVTHEIDANPARRDITVTFDNFTRNGVLIEGQRNAERVLVNENGNPQSTVQVDMLITFVDGSTYSREGSRTREWIEGFGSGVWTDNVFETTGNVTTTNAQGTVLSTTITTPLRRELICTNIVSGSFTVAVNDASGIFDFGNGTCDNEATWTNPNGEIQTIYLD